MKDFIFKHAASRIIQTCIKYGTPEQRISIFTELKGSLPEIASNAYSQFLVPKLLKYTKSVQRSQIIKQFYGKVNMLLKHKIASNAIEGR